MQYMGGKARIAKRLVEAILADTGLRSEWWEPFVGGGNVMEHACQHFDRSVGTDIHPDLMLLWQHVAAGGEIPEMITRERYSELRHNSPSWERALAGFGASFGGKWFGGYGEIKSPRPGRNAEVIRNTYAALTRQGAVVRERSVVFACGSYADFAPPSNSVIYCDPPYVQTTSYDGTDAFDHRAFYARCMEWARSSVVYVSEYSIPEYVPHRLIWELDRRVALKREDNSRIATERLFRILPA